MAEEEKRERERPRVSHRFPMAISPFVAPLLWLFGGIPKWSFVELGEDHLRARFGILFDRTFPIEEVAGARRRRWPLFYGIGWRLTPAGNIGLIGTLRNVVEISFRRRHPIWRVIPIPRFNRLSVSLREPQRFLDTLQDVLDRKGT